MNEDQDFNETAESANEVLENTDATMNDDNDAVSEDMGEAALNNIGKIGGSKPEKKKKKLFASAAANDDKSNTDSRQDEKIAELTVDLQRTRADFENFRRQSDVQKEQYGNAVKFATVKKMLPLLDDIDRAIDANPDTLGPLEKSFAKSVKELGLTKIPAEVGTAFNPDLHDAVMVEGDGEEEVVGEVLRPGYYFGDVVIRPTMVKVKKQ